MVAEPGDDKTPLCEPAVLWLCGRRYEGPPLGDEGPCGSSSTRDGWSASAPTAFASSTSTGRYPHVLHHGRGRAGQLEPCQVHRCGIERVPRDEEEMTARHVPAVGSAPPQVFRSPVAEDCAAMTLSSEVVAVFVDVRSTAPPRAWGQR